MARRVPAAPEAGAACRCVWRSLKSADFPLALSAPILGKSVHFVLHHVAASPNSAIRGPAGSGATELSTDAAPIESPDVDNAPKPRHWWLGLVVPKRHARRAVTRSLLKRQMRAQAEGQRHRLPPGQWVIRLRAPFDPRRFTSAASTPLRDAARHELEQIFARVVSR